MADLSGALDGCLCTIIPVPQDKPARGG